jgi:hypothetical protein
MCVEETIRKMLEDNHEKVKNGTLTVGDVWIHNYIRLTEGEHAGRVLIKAGDRIDGKEILRFANGMTWIFEEKIKDVRCEPCNPTFSPPSGRVDYSKASWYEDSGRGPCYHEW